MFIYIIYIVFIFQLLLLKNTLFGYAREHVQGYLENHFEEPEIQDIIIHFRNEVSDHIELISKG